MSKGKIAELMWLDYIKSTDFGKEIKCRVCKEPRMGYCSCAKRRYTRGITLRDVERFMEKKEIKKQMELMSAKKIKPSDIERSRLEKIVKYMVLDEKGKRMIKENKINEYKSATEERDSIVNYHN